MKSYIIRVFAVLAVIAAVGLIMKTAADSIISAKHGERRIVVQRINDEIGKKLAADSDTAAALNEVFYSRRSEWEQLYGKENSPQDIEIVSAAGNNNNILGSGNTMICCIYTNEELAGFAVYHFEDTIYSDVIMLIYICIGICAAVIIISAEWVRSRLIRPFTKLSDYPERLSKGMITEKLPEDRNGFFGRFIWGMNMLSDKLESDRQLIRRVSLEREKFVTALVHGIKTPAANIKLLSEAISTGLYDPDGKINDKDAELAVKIEKNADEIERIVKEVIEAENTVIFDYDPEAEPFYTHCITDIIREEYSNRMKVARIPFTIEADGDPLVKSDLDGICRILRQLIDNAMKYGDGTGIAVKFGKSGEGYIFTVANNGTPLPESEVPFVFRSLWRGSNSSGIEGSGVGLYESKLIAKKLGGDIRMRTADTLTEVTLFLPL